MPLDLALVSEGMRASNEFAARLIGELHAKYWSHDPGDESAADLRDYVIGASRGVNLNLQSMAVHFQRYEQTRYAQDNAARLRMANGGMPYPDGPDPQHQEREAVMDAAEQAIYVSFGAVFDCLAAVLAGLAGLKTNLIRVDFPALKKSGGDVDFPVGVARIRRMLAPAESPLHEQQVVALRSLAAAVENAGPAGWIEWAIAMRNMVIHREHRNKMITFERAGRVGPITFYRLPPRDPAVSNMGGMRSSQTDITEFYLWEDQLDVFRGLLKSASAAVVGTMEALRVVWNWRMQHQSHVSAAYQWSPPSVRTDFAGYGSEVPKTVLKGAVMVINPADAARLRAAGVGEWPSNPT